MSKHPETNELIVVNALRENTIDHILNAQTEKTIRFELQLLISIDRRQTPLIQERFGKASTNFYTVILQEIEDCEEAQDPNIAFFTAGYLLLRASNSTSEKEKKAYAKALKSMMPEIQNSEMKQEYLKVLNEWSRLGAQDSFASTMLELLAGTYDKKHLRAASKTGPFLLTTMLLYNKTIRGEEPIHTNDDTIGLAQACIWALGERPLLQFIHQTTQVMEHVEQFGAHPLTLLHTEAILEQIHGFKNTRHMVSEIVNNCLPFQLFEENQHAIEQAIEKIESNKQYIGDVLDAALLGTPIKKMYTYIEQLLETYYTWVKVYNAYTQGHASVRGVHELKKNFNENRQRLASMFPKNPIR